MPQVRTLPVASLVLVVVVGLLGLPAAGQGPSTHAAVPGPAPLTILHDVPDDGYTYVGNPVEFGYVVLDSGLPTVHQDGLIRVTQNGVVLYETNEAASHDYDGLNTFTVAFPVAGPYEVYAEVPGNSAATASFTGYVFPNEEATQAKIGLDVAVESGVGSFAVQVTDEAGTIIPHSDAVLEVRRATDNWLVFRTHLHTHEEAMRMTYVFPAPGPYTVRAVGYMAFPGPEAPQFAPVATTVQVDVSPPAVGLLGDVGVSIAGPKGSAPYKLLTSIDPQASSTPFSRFVLSTLIIDSETGLFVPHVNFEAVLEDAAGKALFHSNSLHEYDSLYDVTVHWPIPGQYTLKVNAARGDWVGRAEIPFTVLEVLPTDGLLFPTSAGAMIVEADGLTGLRSGVPSKITFRAINALGHFDAPEAAGAAQHTEIAYAITKEEWGAPILANKIHTHDSGLFEIDVNFPTAGDHYLILDPVTIHGEPTPYFYFGDFGGKLLVPLKVAPGVIFPEVLPTAPPEEDVVGEPANKLPGFEAALLLVGLLAFAFRRRR